MSLVQNGGSVLLNVEDVVRVSSESKVPYSTVLKYKDC